MKKKKNPIYGDSLNVERNDSLFFCALWAMYMNVTLGHFVQKFR